MKSHHDPSLPCDTEGCTLGLNHAGRCDLPAEPQSPALSYKQERDQLREELDRMQGHCHELMLDRDERSEWVTELAQELGCESEWSNLHSHYACVYNAALEWQARAQKAEKSLAGIGIPIEHHSDQTDPFAHGDAGSVGTVDTNPSTSGDTSTPGQAVGPQASTAVSTAGSSSHASSVTSGGTSKEAKLWADKREWKSFALQMERHRDAAVAKLESRTKQMSVYSDAMDAIRIIAGIVPMTFVGGHAECFFCGNEYVNGKCDHRGCVWLKCCELSGDDYLLRVRSGQ